MLQTERDSATSLESPSQHVQRTMPAWPRVELTQHSPLRKGPTTPAPAACQVKQRKVMERSRFEPGGRQMVNGPDARAVGVPNDLSLPIHAAGPIESKAPVSATSVVPALAESNQ